MFKQVRGTTTKAVASAMLIFLSGISSVAMAWGPDGHRATGAIAWELLDRRTQTEVLRLLRLKGERSLAEAGTWADRIRGNENYAWAAPLHYVNFPASWQGYDEKRDCPEHGCILQAINTYSTKLKSRELNDHERAEALLFLVHFVEDIHQPMHTGLKEDRGGNDVELKFYGFPTNLHALWDTYLPAGFIDDWQVFALSQVDQLDRREVMQGSPGNPATWAEESHRLAHTNAYTDRDVLGEAYYEKNKPVVELRLRQGGIRLAMVLRDALTPP